MSSSLRQAIGNPNEYSHTGLVVKTRPDENVYCPCGVKIVYQFEIVNNLSGCRFMIGSTCAKAIGIYIGKLCDTCHQPNSKKTANCGVCRKKCPLHKKYHRSNITHATKRMIFEFGKHRGKSPDELLGEFDDYLIWVVNQQDWKNQDQRQYIIANLLPKCCQSRFKKYPTTPLSKLKVDDPKYFEYMASSDKGCYLQYI